MNLSLTPELERIIREKVASGEFASAEAVIAASLKQLEKNPSVTEPLPASEQRLSNLQALFDEVDRDPAPRTSPLPDDAFDRENLYQDRA